MQNDVFWSLVVFAALVTILTTPLIVLTFLDHLHAQRMDRQQDRAPLAQVEASKFTPGLLDRRLAEEEQLQPRSGDELDQAVRLGNSHRK